MKKMLVKIIGFMAMLVLMGALFVSVFRFKYSDGIEMIQTFYEQPKDSIDVIFFGSSHIFENVNLAELYDSKGIAGYNLCGSVQPIWNTYYYVKEAFKYQSPRLIVVDLFRMTEESEYSDDTWNFKSVMGMRPSLDKLRAIFATFPPEKRVVNILEYPLYHARDDISDEDFLPFKGIRGRKDWKAYGSDYKHQPQERTGVENYTGVQKPLDKCLLYLDKILELADQNNCKVLLVTTPYIATEKEMAIYNYMEEYSASKGVPYINYLKKVDEIGLDYERDFRDSAHLTWEGGTKLTRMLSDDILSLCDFPDRRGDPAYASYDRFSAQIKAYIDNGALQEEYDRDRFLELANSNDNYLIITTARGNYLSTEEGKAIADKSLEMVSQYRYADLDHKTHIRMADDDGTVKLFVNEVEYYSVGDGLNLFIYDTLLGCIVECAGFPWDGSCLSDQKVSWEYVDGEWRRLE